MLASIPTSMYYITLNITSATMFPCEAEATSKADSWTTNIHCRYYLANFQICGLALSELHLALYVDEHNACV